jgi:uncharacterized membrane protein YuzA (DUF378 family)
MRKEVILMKWVHMIAYMVLFVGGLNWGLVGLFNFNLVSFLFGSMQGVEKFVYVLVGLSTVYVMATHKADCKICGDK